MIVDDEVSVRVTLKAVLKSGGHETSEYKSCDEAWEKLHAGEKPEIVLLDLMLPGMRPIDLIKNIKQDPNLKDIKIIYVTAVSGAKKAAESEKDVFSTLEKPFRNEELLALIESALK